MLYSRINLTFTLPYLLFLCFSGLGFVVGSNVAKLAGSWQWGVRVTPMLGAVCLLLIILVLKEPERGASEDKGRSADSMNASSFLEDLRALAKK